MKTIENPGAQTQKHRLLPSLSLRRHSIVAQAVVPFYKVSRVGGSGTLSRAPQRQASSYSPLSATQSFPPSPISDTRRRSTLQTTP